MILFHGTSSTQVEKIMEEGLTSSYLTDDQEIAEYYADVTCDEVDGHPVLFSVDISEEVLLPDVNAISEPVMRDEDEVMEAFALVPHEWLSEPDPWKVSLALVSPPCKGTDIHRSERRGGGEHSTVFTTSSGCVCQMYAG